MALLTSKVSKEARLAAAKKHGRVIAGPDDPVYSEGSSITFKGASPAGIIIKSDDELLDEEYVNEAEKIHTNYCELNSVTHKILCELTNDYLHCHHSLDASDVESLIELDEDVEKVGWISSTWIEPAAVNLYLCSVKGEPDNVLATEHSDGGVLVEIKGPWLSVDDAKASYGFVNEGWSDL